MRDKPHGQDVASDWADEQIVPRFLALLFFLGVAAPSSGDLRLETTFVELSVRAAEGLTLNLAGFRYNPPCELYFENWGDFGLQEFHAGLYDRSKSLRYFAQWQFFGTSSLLSSTFNDTIKGTTTSFCGEESSINIGHL